MRDRGKTVLVRVAQGEPRAPLGGSRAIARPIPLAAPVSTAVRPVKSSV